MDDIMADDSELAEKWWFSLSKQSKYNVAGSSCCDNPETWWSALDKEGKILTWKTCGSCTW